MKTIESFLFSEVLASWADGVDKIRRVIADDSEEDYKERLCKSEMDLLALNRKILRVHNFVLHESFDRPGSKVEEDDEE